MALISIISSSEFDRDSLVGLSYNDGTNFFFNEHNIIKNWYRAMENFIINSNKDESLFYDESVFEFIYKLENNRWPAVQPVKFEIRGDNNQPNFNSQWYYDDFNDGRRKIIFPMFFIESVNVRARIMD